MNLELMKEELSYALDKYDNEFKAKHAECIDFGTCGYATVLIAFGRKAKLKKDFNEAGLLGMEWSSTGKKTFSVEIPRGNVPTQNMTYYVNRANVAKAVVESYLEGSGVDVNVHSWVD